MKINRNLVLTILLTFASISLIAQANYGCKVTDTFQPNSSKSLMCTLTCPEISNCYEASYNLVFHFVANGSGQNFTCDPNDPIVTTNPMLYVPTIMYWIRKEMNDRFETAVLGVPDPDAKIRFEYLNGSNCNSAFFYSAGQKPQPLNNAINIIFVNDPNNQGIRGWTNYGSNRIFIENVLAEFLAGSQDYWSLGRLINHEFGHTRNLRHSFNCNNPCDGVDLVAVDECCGQCWPTDSNSSGCWQCSDDDLMMGYGIQKHLTKCELLELWCYIIDNPEPYQTVTNSCNNGPDLVNTFTSVSSTMVTCGGVLTAYSTVENIGNSSTNTFSNLGYYLSTDMTWDASDTYLNQDYVGTLAAGASSTENAPLTIPANVAAGTYYILFVADHNNNVAEGDENNNVASQAITVSCGGPDLITSFSSLSSSSVTCGSSIIANAVVKNIGNSSTNTYSYLGYYLSTNTAWDASDTYLAQDYVGTLSSGSTSSESASLTIPANLAAGTYYILFVADRTDRIAETLENNNLAVKTITVSCNGPDLTNINTTVGGSPVNCGGTISANTTVKNTGAGSTNTYSYLGYYLSPNATWDASDTYLTQDYVGTLIPGGISYESATLTIPSNLTAGTYYILFVADHTSRVPEANENNNVAHKVISVVSCGGPDLTNFSTSISSSIVSCGSTITANTIVENIGNSSTNTYSYLGYYLSTNTIWDAGDTYLTQDYVPTLGSGGSSSENATLTIPTTLNSGTYYILFVADRTDRIGESNENNNVVHKAITVTCASGPDLTNISASVSTSSVSCESVITATATVKNIGGSSTNTYSYLGYYLSTNSTWDAGDSYLTQDYVGSLGSGSSSNETAPLFIPGNLSPGTYYILFVADHTYRIPETNENNNVTAIAITVTCGCVPDVPTASEIDNAGNIYCTYAYGICQGHTGDHKQFQLTNLATGSIGNFYSTTHFVLFPNLTQGTNYRYRVRMQCGTTGPYGGWSPFEYFTTTSCSKAENGTVATITEATEHAPFNDILPGLRNFPNPFNGQTTLEFDLSDDAIVTLYVSDMTGKQIEVVLNNEQRSGGIHHVNFDGSNHPAGLYYFTLKTGEHLITKKMILIK